MKLKSLPPLLLLPVLMLVLGACGGEAAPLPTYTPYPTYTPFAPLPTYTPYPTPLLTATPTPPPTTTPEPVPTAIPSGKWMSYSSTDPLTDKPNVRTRLFAADDSESSFVSSIQLWIQCTDNQIRLYIDWDTFMTTQSPLVTWRVGSDMAETSNWLISTDYQATFHPSPNALITQLVRSGDESFVAQVTPYGENPLTATWELVGIEQAVQPVRKACGW